VRVLITGAGGQVGQDLTSVLAGETPPGGASTSSLDGRPVHPGEFDVIALDRARLDVTDQVAVNAVVEEIRPDVIVHLAAYTAVDKAEHDVEGARRLNQVATGFLDAAAGRVGAHLIYTSTDYVFDGELGRPLVESDATNPLSVYGATKLGGELACADSVSIVRTSWVAGVRGKNLFHLATSVGRDGRELRFVEDQVGTPTSSADLAAGLVAFVRERPAGIFHVAGSGQASWYEAIQHAVVVAGGSTDQVSPIRTVDLDPQPAAHRPAFSPLRSERLEPLGWSPLPDWHEGIERLVVGIGAELDASGAS
jgi:dTDP-4-dehydrorhamnose reductase